MAYIDSLGLLLHHNLNTLRWFFGVRYPYPYNILITAMSIIKSKGKFLPAVLGTDINFLHLVTYLYKGSTNQLVEYTPFENQITLKS